MVGDAQCVVCTVWKFSTTLFEHFEDFEDFVKLTYCGGVLL